MKFFAVIYDLRQPGRRYNQLYDAIKELAGTGNWQHPMESFWLLSFSVYSSHTSNSIYETLQPHIDINDSIMVCEIDPTNGQGWMPKSTWIWIKEQKEKA